ncbi:hypothetical protein Taro_034360, partial [Colocasia esculenta]|nr:hypothetical protein [Colocasia esculenta]
MPWLADGPFEGPCMPLACWACRVLQASSSARFLLCLPRLLPGAWHLRACPVQRLSPLPGTPILGSLLRECSRLRACSSWQPTGQTLELRGERGLDSCAESFVELSCLGWDAEVVEAVLFPAQSRQSFVSLPHFMLVPEPRREVRTMLCSFLVAVALPSRLRCIAWLPYVLVRFPRTVCCCPGEGFSQDYFVLVSVVVVLPQSLRCAVGLAGVFWRVFPERCLGGSGGGSPRTCLCCFCSSSCCSVLSDGLCCLVVGLCILVKVLPRIALCRFWWRFFPGVLCVCFGPPLCCPCGSKCAVWLCCILARFSQDGSWHFGVEVLPRAASCCFGCRCSLSLFVEMSCRCCWVDCLCYSLLGHCRSRHCALGRASGCCVGQVALLFISRLRWWDFMCPRGSG